MKSLIANSRFRTWPIDATTALHPELAKLGLKLAPEAIDGTRPGAPATALSNALVSVGPGGRGGTGSFLSAQGLVITNHHVALDAIRRASRKDGKDYLREGFVAPDRASEAKTEYECWITRSVEDCSAAVLEKVTATDPLQRANELRDAALAVAAAKEKTLPSADLRVKVDETWPGRTYALVTHERLADVRLVYAPPKSLASFGGDEDNFEWPRHSADFALLRCYAGGEPYKPKCYLKAAPAGASEDDLVFVLGFPGFTMRYAPSARLRYTRDVGAPGLVKELREKLAHIATVDASGELKVAASRASLANEAKRSSGKCVMLAKVGLVEQRAAEEAALVETTPAAKPLLDSLTKVYAAVEKDGRRQEALDKLRGARYGSALMEVAFALYDAAIEQAKPEGKREAYLRDRNRSALAARLARRLDDIHPPHEAALLLDALCGANWCKLYPEPESLPAPELLHRRALNHLSMPTDDKVGTPVQKMEPTKEHQRMAASIPMNPAAIPNWPYGGVETLEAARKLVDSSPLRQLDADALEECLANPYDQSRKILDHPITGAVEACYGTFQAARDDLRANLAKRDDLCAKLEALSGDAATRHPDCNGSLRMSVGKVEGYAPADAVTHRPLTTLAGLDEKRVVAALERDAATAALFAPPARLVRTLDEAPAARRTPVNVLYSTDTLGGNSGSPVLDATGRFVAINFDRPRHGLVNEFCWSADFSRSVGCDVRYVLWLVGAYDGATALVEEILRDA